MFKRILLLLPLSFCGAFEVNLQVGPQIEHFNGWISYKGNSVDLKKDLHIEDKVKYFASVDIKHNISLLLFPIPNLKVEYLKVESSGYGKVSKSFTFGALSVNVNDRVYSKFKLDQVDLTLYYTPLNVGVVKGSFGLGGKFIDFKGYIRSETTGRSDKKSLTIPLPYLYARVEGNFLLVKPYAEGKALPLGNNYFYDLSLGLRFEKEIVKTLSLGLSGGYRLQRYRVDGISDVSSDVRMKGFFAALGLTFSF